MWQTGFKGNTNKKNTENRSVGKIPLRPPQADFPLRQDFGGQVGGQVRESDAGIKHFKVIITYSCYQGLLNDRQNSKILAS